MAIIVLVLSIIMHTSTSNGNNNVSDISNSTKTSISENVSSQNLSESDYIGQGVLAGQENNSEMELEVESQKRSHPDSDSVDFVDDSSFATPVAPPLTPPKRSQLLSSPRALLGPLLLTVTAAAVGLQNAHLRPTAPTLLAPMFCHLLLVMCRSLPGALVALKAPHRGDSLFTLMALSIIQLNINGIRNSDKRAGLLQWLRSLSVVPDVVCLQEAHCVSDVECQSWFRSSGFHSVVSPGSQKSCGCVILFRTVVFLR